MKASTDMTLLSALQLAESIAASLEPGDRSQNVTLSLPLFTWMVRRVMASHTPDMPISYTPGNAAYETTYHVHLRGTFRKNGERVLIITDGLKVTRIELKLVQFLVLIILASLARKETGLDAPLDVRGGDYLEPERIVQEIKTLKTRESALNDRADNLTTAYIYKARWEVRQRLRNMSLNPNLLESYRLSVPPEQIRITLFDEDGSLTWG